MLRHCVGAWRMSGFAGPRTVLETAWCCLVLTKRGGCVLFEV